MKHKALPSLVFSFSLLSAVPIYAQHGGSGGHAGGGSSGHASGHSGGRASGRLSGQRSGGHGIRSARAKAHSEMPPYADAAMIHGRIIQLPTPSLGILRRNRFRRPITEFGFGVSSRHFLYGNLGCLEIGYRFDPFCFGGIFLVAVGQAEFDGPVDSTAPDQNGPDDEYQNSVSGALSSPTATLDDQEPSKKSAKPKAAVLLQLKDGSMYGLTDYWVMDGRLRYVTDYGGSNSIPLDRIDLDKTNQLNADRGVKFFVQVESSQH